MQIQVVKSKIHRVKVTSTTIVESGLDVVF